MAATTPRRRHSSNVQGSSVDVPSITVVHDGHESQQNHDVEDSPPSLVPDVDKDIIMDNQDSSSRCRLPLTWNEARSRIRKTLDQWNSERKQQRIFSAKNDHVESEFESGSKKSNLFSLVDVDDPDMIFLTIPLSLLFAIASFVIPLRDDEHSSSYHNMHNSSFTEMQQAGAMFFLLSSITSAWITKRRRKISRETDKSIERRRCVSAFLKGMKCCEHEHEVEEERSNHRRLNNLTTEAMFNNVDTIPRKNVEDVYSTYRLINHTRRSTESNNNNNIASDEVVEEGQWHRIPTLLLVKGDYIALKVGDTAPAKCTGVPSAYSEKSGSNNGCTNGIVFEAGERLTIKSMSPLVKESLALSDLPDSASAASIATIPTSNATTTKSTNPKHHKKGGGLLPAGRSTLKYHSEEMLLLANGVKIFVLLETPLDSFLRKEDDGKDQYVTPQVLRQGEAIRAVLLRFALLVFLVTLIILLVRPGGAQNLFKSSSTWSLPLLAALGVLPVLTPIFLFWVECIGTTRILAAVHPIASNQKQRIEPKGMSADGYCQTSVLSMNDDQSSSEHLGLEKPATWLLCRYLMATATSRLFTKSLLRKIKSMLRKISSWTHRSDGRSSSSSDALLSIPPASLHLLEKLGVVTALALVDDELACEPFSTPQQLLIPSGQGGLKLLDICPVFDEDDGYSTEDEDNANNNNSSSPYGSRRHSSDLISIDSDDSNEETRFNHSFSAPARTIRRIRRNYRKKKYIGSGKRQRNLAGGVGFRGMIEDDEDDVEVQFEDPNWWQFLPSLKCIGLGCALVEEPRTEKRPKTLSQQKVHDNSSQKVSFNVGRNQVSDSKPYLTKAETSLIDHICCEERERKQLQLLAQCIGFDTTPNALGPRGDLTSFQERKRLHILDANLLRNRMQLDSHALALEECRNWSRLFTDADTVFVRDRRSGGDLVLTVGDARVVTQLCPDWWQGENVSIAHFYWFNSMIIFII